MNNKISIIGGDLRIIKLSEMFLDDNYEVFTYGLEKSDNIQQFDKIEKCKTLKEAIQKSDIIVGPIPFSRNNIEINAPFSNQEIYVRELMENLTDKIFIAGSISSEVYKMSNEYTHIVDLMKREELAVLNTIATAEGAIEVAISNTNKILHGSNVLILGFGRIGKILARKLNGLSAKVTCAARKIEDLAWIETYGYDVTDIKKLGENLKKFDIIINTVPNIILTKEKLEYVGKETLIIDLASNPGGVDQKSIKENNLKFVWALSLPGKVAPITSAKFIKDTIYNVLKEI